METAVMNKAVTGTLLIPVSRETIEALEAISTVLMTAEASPQSLHPMEENFRHLILGACHHLEHMDSETIYRLSQLASVKRPAKLWDIVSHLIQCDNDRLQRTGRWSPSDN